MSNSTNKWKEYLLKSSIPLEYEIKKILEAYGCVGNYEYTYMRRDENEILNEFSYDIDMAYFQGDYFFELMIECKYRDQSTNWIFLPEPYGGIDDIEPYSFLNHNDHFTLSNKFAPLNFEPYASLCGKGIEVNSSGQNPKSITQAVSQLSYAMAEKIVSGMQHQVDRLLGNTDYIFCHVPIIVTTANLYRLREDITLSQIKDADDINEVSEKETCLILKAPTGKHLENHNLEILNRFVSEYGESNLNNKLSSFNVSIDFVCQVIAKQYCPSAVAIIQFTEDNIGFEKLFNFLDEVAFPSEKTFERMKDYKERLHRIQKLSKQNKPG